MFRIKKLLLWAVALSAACAVQAQFTFTHIGGGATGDIITNDAATGSYTFNGGGDDIWSGSDNFDFAHYTVTGDFDMSVRVESVEPVARWTKAGLMVREVLVPTARMAFTRACPPDVPTGNGGNGVNDVKFMYRTGVTSNGQGEHEEGSGAPAYPNAWIRLLRSGNRVESYRSTDATNWFLLGAQDTATWEGGALPAKMEFGLAVSRHSSADTIATAEFRNYGPTPLSIASVPLNQLVSVGQPAVFSVGVPSGFASHVAYQWYQGGVAISGATASTYTKNSPALSDNGSAISVVVSNRLNGLTATAAATLSVIVNPQLLTVSSKGDPNGVYLTFSRDMDTATTLNKDNYSIDGAVAINSATAVNSKTVKLAVSALTFGATYQVMVGGIQDAAGSVISPDPVTANFVHGANMAAPVGLVLKRFDGIGGGAVNDLLNAAIFPCSPSYTDSAIPGMEYGTDPVHNNNGETFLNTYGTWMYGVFVPTVSGNYRFANTSDDSSALYLSTDATAASKVLVRSQDGWAPDRNYDGRLTSDIYLEAGRGYYMEVLQKEDGGGDHVTVAMQIPGGDPIANGQAGIAAANFASRYSYGCPPQFFFNTLGPVAITHDVADKAVNEGWSTQFSVEADGSAPYTIQWYRNGAAIPGATKFTLSVPAASSNHLATYHAVVNNDFSTVTSATATLTVNPAIQLVSASSRNDATGIYVKFSKAVDASAADTAKYVISGGVTASGASIFAPDTVRLTVPTLANGNYTVTVQNVLGATGEPMLPATAEAAFTHFDGTFTADFSALPSGGAVYGSAAIADGYLKITTAVNDQNGAFLLNDFSGGHPLAKFRLTWNAYVASGGTPADGFSFNLGNDLPSGTIGNAEEGTGSGLILSFDTYNNGNNEAPAIDIKVGGQTIHHQYPFQVMTGTWVPVILEVSADGKLYLNYNNTVITTNLQTNLRLNPGAKYYFAGRTGGSNEDAWIDNLSITLFTPGPMVMLVQPSDATVNERDVVTWRVAADGSGPHAYQWHSNGVAIAGATGTSYSFTALRFANGAQYTVTASNGFSGVTSAPWTLSVVNDTTAPTLASQAVGSATLKEVTLTFSEPIDQLTATSASSYVITNSSGATLAVLSGRAISSTQVILTTALQTSGEKYTVVANGVVDRSGGLNAIAADSLASFTAWVFTPGFVLMETFETGGGTTVPLLRIHATYPYFPRERFFINSFDSREKYPTDSHENYGGRISGVFIAPTNGDYKFYAANDDAAEVYMATDAIGTGNLPLFSSGCCGTWVNSSPLVTLAAGDQRYMEILWKEGGGGDYGRLSLDANKAISAEMIGMYANPDTTKVYIVQAPSDRTSSPNQFAKFTVIATNTAQLPQIYQWQRYDSVAGVFTNIPGAFGTNNTLTVGPMATDLSDTGSEFQVVVHTPGSSASAAASLTVVQDNTPPTIISATTDGTLRKIHLTFSEPMETDSALGLDTPSMYMDPNGVFCIGAVEIVNASEIILTVDEGSCGALAEGTIYTIQADGIQDANGQTIASPGNTIEFTTWVRSRGVVKYDFYTQIGGGNIAALLSSPKYPNAPDVTYLTNTTAWPQSSPTPDGMSDYGLRMSGYFYAQVSGVYTFALKHDDDARLQISTDDTAANLATVIEVACCHGDFFGDAQVTMEAGRYYYFEALVKEAGGGDYLTVGVRAPGSSTTVAIPGINLMMPLETTVAPNAGIAQQPQGITIPENTSTILSIVVTNAAPFTPVYQWQVNDGSGFTEIAGANSGTFKTPAIALAQSGIQYRALVYVPGRTLVSASAAITVLADTNAPVLLSAASANGTQVGVRFNEAVNATFANNVNNYLVNDEVPASATLRADGRNVVLIPTTPVGSEFKVEVFNIQDVAVVPNELMSASVIGKFWLENVVDIRDPLPAGQHFSAAEGDIEILAGGEDVWGTSDQFTYAYAPRTNDFDVKVRVDRLDYVGNAWAKGGLNVRESIEHNSRMVWFYPGPLEGSKQFEGAIRMENGGDITDFGQPRPNSYFPAWLRLSRVGSQFTAYLSPDGTNWNQFGATQNAPQFPARLLIGVGATSHLVGTHTTAQFSEFGDMSPLLKLQELDGELVIRWDGTGVLQYTDSLSTPNWTAVPGATSPFTVPIAQAQRYYRVQRLFPAPTP